MKGLIVKDLYTLGNLKKNYLLMVVLVIALSLFMNSGPTYIISMLTVYMLMTSTTLFSYDESSHWDRYAIAMPVTRRTIVGARYLMALIQLAAVVLLGGALSVIVSLYHQVPDWPLTLAGTTGAMSIVYLVVISVSYPLAFRFSAEKARYALMACYLIPFLLFMVFIEPIVTFFEALELAAFSIPLLICLVALVCLLLFAASFFLSLRFYSKKEF